MAVSAENRIPCSQPCPRRRRRRRRKPHIFLNTALCLTFAAALILAGVACWRGLQLLWSGIEQALDALGHRDSVISLFDTPEESTSADREAPVLSGVQNITVYQGDTIMYMQGISATDVTDANPTITVDNQCVDLSRPGEYPITYTAADASGNESQASALVTVLEKREDYAELSTIYAAADAKLEEIIRENATLQQKVHDIYAWARLNLSYGGHSDRADWRQTAYKMLTDGRGDCFGYYAVTKLLFERLGIPNIDVQKVKNFPEDSDHFWSLLSLDEGVTWYHFDATPRYGDGDDFCLVTDAFLDAYSQAHDGSHNRDHTRYPETP